MPWIHCRDACSTGSRLLYHAALPADARKGSSVLWKPPASLLTLLTVYQRQHGRWGEGPCAALLRHLELLQEFWAAQLGIDRLRQGGFDDEVVHGARLGAIFARRVVW